LIFILDILKDVIHDTWTMLPLLYITYIVLEFFERRQNTDDRLFFGLQKLGPILGAFIGLIPQCGFSILAAMLFVQNNITLGTLVSVMIATSDEAIPILISNPSMYSSLLWILILKLIIAIVVGMFTDHVLFRRQKILHFEDMEEDDDQEEYEEEPEGSGCPCCYPEYPMWLSALIRSLKIYIFIFITSFILTLLMECIGSKTLSTILLHNSLLQPVIASLFGFIPNCAATVVLTQLFTSGELSFGSLLAGLITNAGLGLVVMIRYEARKRDLFRVISILFVTAVIVGITFMLI
jgi:hypothetical protein